MMQFNKDLFDVIWEKAKPIPGLDPYLFRKDEWGTTIRKVDFNNETSVYGWCIHYIIPPWEGGPREPVNLQPVNLHNEIQFLNNHIMPWKDDASIWD